MRAVELHGWPYNAAADKKIDWIYQVLQDISLASHEGDASDAGLALTYDTRTVLTTSRVPSTVNGIRTMGYTTIGDGGGASYMRVGAEPSHAGKVQSLDGAWWELVSIVVTPEMFGGSETDTTANNTALTAIVAYLGVRGGGTVLLNKLYQRTSTLTVDQPYITFTSTNGGGVWLRGNGLQGNSTHLFYVSPDGDNTTFRGIEIRGDTGITREHSNFAILNKGDNLLVEYCYIHDLLSGCWCWNCFGTRLIYNRLEDLIAGGFQMSNGAVRWLIHGNRARRLSDDAFCSVTETQFVTDNPAEFSPLTRSSNGVISNNIALDTLSTASPIRVTSSDHVVVSGNTIKRCAGSGITVAPHDGAGINFDVVVANNSIRDYGLAYSADATFANSNKTPMSACGIRLVEGELITVIGNNMSEETPTGYGRGIAIDGVLTDAKVKGNHISDTTYGIAAADIEHTTNIYDLTLEDNTISNTVSWPIYINPNGVTVRDFIITGTVARNCNSGAGMIRVENTGAAVVLVQDNTSFSSGAVSIDGGTATAVTEVGSQVF